VSSCSILALFHNLSGDFAEFDVAVLRDSGQVGEGTILVQVIALHQDADGLTYHLAGKKRGVEFFFSPSPAEGYGGVRGE
jgi:hypothetical protein